MKATGNSGAEYTRMTRPQPQPKSSICEASVRVQPAVHLASQVIANGLADPFEAIEFSCVVHFSRSHGAAKAPGSYILQDWGATGLPGLSSDWP